MNYEAKHRLKLKKSANRLAKFQYIMAERIKKGDLKWKRREASGKASAGLRPVHKIEREEWVPKERPTISMVKREK